MDPFRLQVGGVSRGSGIEKESSSAPVELGWGCALPLSHIFVRISGKAIEEIVREGAISELGTLLQIGPGQVMLET